MGIQDSKLIDTNWQEGGRVHNWRKYVGEKTRALWDTFTIEQKRALAEDADEFADRERWE